MRSRLTTAVLSVLFAVTPHLAGQTPPEPAPQQTPPQTQTTPPPSPPDATTPPLPQQTTAQAPPAAAPAQTQPSAPAASATAQAQPPVLSRAASAAYERHDALPEVNVYLPEGQASVRLRKLIKNVLFESQIDYRFVNGDISTYLRYKYYARNFTYRIGVFDQIGFPNLGTSSKQEFQRVRGGLLLFEFPRDYDHRYYWLIQDDRLTFGNVADVDNRKNNVYTKVAYQYGTQFDDRLNSIAGESRGRITPVLTAFRDLGSQRFSLAGAITESAHTGTGSYKYTKFEGEALKRSDINSTSFVVTRLHAGFFVGRDQIRCLPNDPTPCQYDPTARYSIPLYEMFRLGERGALRSIGDKPESEGTHEMHLTNEYFVPVFRNRDFRSWLLHWNTLYAIGYAGLGSVAFEFRDIAKRSNDVVDAGLGAETTLTFRDYDVILSVIYAHTVHAPDALKGGRVRFMIRTMR